MLSSQATSVRGRRTLYPYGGTHRSITDLLSDPAVESLVTRGTQMTPGSQRNRIRSLLRRGEVTPETVAAYAATHPPPGLPAPPGPRLLQMKILQMLMSGLLLIGLLLIHQKLNLCLSGQDKE